ncbi:MAG: hypothetical protein ACKOBV_01075 [Candidatus Kapaibacterium sp.]
MRHIVRLAAAVATATILHGQSAPLTLPSDTGRGTPYAVTGFTKMAATFLFIGDADLRTDAGPAEILLRQQYRGSTIRTAVAAFRDDESLNLVIRSRNLRGITPMLTSDAQVSRDSRSIGINSLTRWNLASGMRLSRDSSTFVEVLGGGESNTLLGIRDRGAILRVNGAIADVDADPFRASLALTSEATFFSRRTNGDVQSSLTLLREIDERTSLMFRVGYRALHRDWYSQTTDPVASAPVTVIENRFENIVTVESRLLFPLARSVHSDISIALLNNDITRAFKDVVEGLPLTKAVRDLSQLQLAITAVNRYEAEHHRHAVTVTTLIRDEQNTAERRVASLGALQLDTLREQERIRDNAQWRTLAGTRSIMDFGPTDTVTFQSSASIMRYDTPGASNNDDRDELNTYLSASYSHAWSPFLTTTISSRLQLNHLVFLKAQRSALNAWNRILQFSPSAVISTPALRMRPQFEVLAQYTVYDFEGKAGVPTSFSFRQVSYRDSILVPLNTRLLLELQVYARVFERGELYWASFAELPQSHNYEQFLRCVVTSDRDRGARLGFGARYYALSQQSLTRQTSGNTLIQSLAPESVLSMPLLDRARLDVRGWLEFQYTNTVFSRIVPNISFLVRTSL